jgi:hypothetical protein
VYRQLQRLIHEWTSYSSYRDGNGRNMSTEMDTERNYLQIATEMDTV